MTMREFSAASRIETPASPVTRTSLEEELSRRNLGTRIRMSTQHVAAIPFVVAACECIAAIPRDVFELFSPIAAIKAVKLPVNITPIQVHQYWHRRVGSDPAVKFFRELVFATARGE